MSSRLDTYLRRHLVKAETLLQKLRQDLSPGKVHDLRVEVRRIRSIIWMLREGSLPGRLQKLDKSLRRLNRRLGRVRELDVALRDAKDLDLKRARLKRVRKKSRESLEKYLSRAGPKLAKRLDRAGGSEVPESALHAGILKLVRELKRDLSQRDGQIHQLRIDIKRAHYVLEAFGHKPKAIGELQSSLGRVHDYEILGDLVGRKKVKPSLDLHRARAQRDIPSGTRAAISELNTLSRSCVKSRKM